MKTNTLLPSLILSTMLLTACSGVMNSAQAAKQYYMLMPLTGASMENTDAQTPGLAMNLTAVPGLDSDWIQALGTDARLTRYANARWPDHLPEVLTSVIQRSLAATGRFSPVDVAPRSTGGAWFLRLEVQKFYGLQDADGQTKSVVVELYGSIECGDHRESFTLNEAVPVGGERLSTVVAAHQQGLDKVTQELLDKIAGACS
jgi:ABC-type uncharacterized transport system auxiliary subunit